MTTFKATVASYSDLDDVDPLSLSDSALGAWLPLRWAADAAERAGVPFSDFNARKAEWMDLAMREALRQETTTAAAAAVGQAFRRAASGNFEAAGRLLREHLIDGAIAFKFIPLGRAQAHREATFVSSAATRSKVTGAANLERVRGARDAFQKKWEAAHASLTPSPSKRNIADAIASDLALSSETVRKLLKKLG